MAGLGLLALAQEQRRQAERAALEVTRALATAVDVELGRSIAVLRGISVGPSLDTGDLVRYREVMRRTVETRPDWLTITLADPSGQQLANTRRPFGEPLPMVVDLPSLAAAVRTRQPVVGALTTGPGGEIAIPARVPVLRDGEVRYVLTAAVKPDAFVEALARQRLPDDWVVSIFDAQPVRVARSRRHAEYLNQPPSPSLEKLMREAPGDEATGITQALEGDEIYTAFTRSPQFGWSVAIGVPRGAVDAAAWRSLAAYGGGLLLSLALATLAALLVGRGIAAPIARLAAAARALGRRQPLEAPETRIREIREVGSALAGAARERAAHEHEREELLRREQAARASAEGASRAKDEFLAMLGHELRNPLGALTSASHLLQDPRTDGETTRRAREVVARQVRHLARLTDDLLDTGRALLGKIVLQRRPLDLAAVVGGALSTLQAAGRLGGHRIRSELESVWVDADFARIEQIVNNLVGNALKYTPEGGSIRVRVARDGAHAVLGVSDSGVGIGAELLGRVFDPFVQGPRELDRSHGGLGIGLTLVRRLAELHGGAASAASGGTGKGAQFEVRFPLIEPPAVAEVSARRLPAMAPREILLVEDNDDAAEMLRGMLELAGHRVRVVPDGEQGLAALRESPPDIAFIDIGLPRLNGYEVAQQARAAFDGQRGPLLVALTGYGLADDRRRALQAGFDEHLVKPVDAAALEKILAASARAP
jgi:signal transduction histidine kinase/ActR/RegA family two-component response regulator